LRSKVRAVRSDISMSMRIYIHDGEADGKLNPDTRAGLKKYQEAEGLKVTGTLNGITLQKMSIPLTEKQQAMMKATM
jgi:peptidoglycan hydrolase-like protein with peptidoglycan-binding domain